MADNKDALKAEANGTEDETRDFEFNGHVYTVPHPDEWGVDVIEAYENERIVTAIHTLLGEKQWREYKRRENPKVKDLNAFIEAMFAKTSGVDSGE